MERVELREARAIDLLLLRDMLYEAPIVALEVRALEPTEVLELPVVARYLLGWGRHGDHGVGAVGPDGIGLGAAWFRLYPAHERGYGRRRDPRTGWRGPNAATTVTSGGQRRSTQSRPFAVAMSASLPAASAKRPDSRGPK
jgi:hypothetical protein